MKLLTRQLFKTIVLCSLVILGFFIQIPTALAEKFEEKCRLENEGNCTGTDERG